MASYVNLPTYLKFHREFELVDNSIELVGDQFPNNVYIESHLEAASSRADSYLAIRYKVPILNPGLELIRVVCSIAKWDMEILGEIREATQVHYEDALLWLEKIRDGDIGLIDGAGNLISPIGSDAVDETQSGLPIYRSKLFTGDRATRTQIPRFGPGLL